MSLSVVKPAAWFVLGVLVAWSLQGRGAHADVQPAFDRGLTERMVRAIEAQAHATEALVRATDKLHK